jgi:hypothetical protein
MLGNPTVQRDGAGLLNPEIDDLLLQLRGLVLVRGIPVSYSHLTLPTKA